MTRLAQLSVADLIERRVPLSAAEAVALTLAIDALLASGPYPEAAPADQDIFLGSTGEVTVAARGIASTGEQPQHLAALLHRLLGLDGNDAGDRRGRAPGALLVALARTLRQIDLPPLAADAFRDALRRFSTSSDPAMLAAVFWRAARMRPRRARRLAAGDVPGAASSGRGADRRLHGANPAQLRRWLRQSERDLFTLRARMPVAQASRRLMLAAAGCAVVMVIGVLGAGLSGGGSAGESRASAAVGMSVGTSPERPILVDTITRPAAIAAAAPKAPLRPARPRVARARTRTSAGNPTRVAAKPVRAAAATPPPARRARTVEMVNLPRSTWAVVH